MNPCSSVYLQEIPECILVKDQVATAKGTKKLTKSSWPPKFCTL